MGSIVEIRKFYEKPINTKKDIAFVSEVTIIKLLFTRTVYLTLY